MSNPDNSALPSIYKIMKPDCRASSLLLSPSGVQARRYPGARYRLRRVESRSQADWLAGWRSPVIQRLKRRKGETEGGPEACRALASERDPAWGNSARFLVLQSSPRRHIVHIVTGESAPSPVISWIERGESREREHEVIPRLCTDPECSFSPPRKTRSLVHTWQLVSVVTYQSASQLIFGEGREGVHSPRRPG